MVPAPQLLVTTWPKLLASPTNCWHSSDHSTYVRLLFAHNVAQFRARRQEKKSSMLWPVLLVVVVFYCPMACSAFLPYGGQTGADISGHRKKSIPRSYLGLGHR